jgi:hypothetical protein
MPHFEKNVNSEQGKNNVYNYMYAYLRLPTASGGVAWAWASFLFLSSLPFFRLVLADIFGILDRETERQINPRLRGWDYNNTKQRS